MKEKAEQGYVNSKDNILNQDSAIFIRILVFLYLFMSTSAQTRECSVVRSRYGDRIVFNNYTGACNKEVNPCRQLNSVWNASSMKNCYCQCSRQNCAYREDLKTCVKNKESRDGRYILFFFSHGCYYKFDIISDLSFVNIIWRFNYFVKLQAGTSLARFPSKHHNRLRLGTPGGGGGGTPIYMLYTMCRCEG